MYHNTLYLPRMLPPFLCTDKEVEGGGLPEVSPGDGVPATGLPGVVGKDTDLNAFLCRSSTEGWEKKN